MVVASFAAARAALCVLPWAMHPSQLGGADKIADTCGLRTLFCQRLVTPAICRLISSIVRPEGKRAGQDRPFSSQARAAPGLIP